MSSHFSYFLAQAHQDDLRRSADRERLPATECETTRAPSPTFLRSRRLGRLVRMIPSPSRPTV
jgi:hypothetical protein